MFELLCWFGIALVIICLTALVSFVCHEEADERREHIMNKYGSQ